MGSPIKGTLSHKELNDLLRFLIQNDEAVAIRQKGEW